MQCDFYSR